jgi:hypothetical protein
MKTAINTFFTITFMKSAALIATTLCAIFIWIFLSSCEETVHLDLKQTQSKLAIEGQITNHDNYQYVKVSRSADFYSAGKTPAVTNANITVTDNLGNIYSFTHYPGNNPDSAGFYLPQIPFTGTIGRTYKLKAEVDGIIYEAQDDLAAVTKIDSLGYKTDLQEIKDAKVKGRYYQILLYTQEPRDQANYYLFKFYRNDSLVYNGDTDIYFSDDQFLAGNIDGVASPVYYSLGDKGRVEMYSISKAGYIFYNDLSTLLNNDAGGMFGPIPATPRTNLTNGALGFFQASAVDVSHIKIE